MPPKLKFTRQEIIDAAFNLVRQNGWQNLTARKLAGKLGSSARPIYSFFNKIRLLEEEVVKKAVTLLYDYMQKDRTGDPWHDHGIGYVLFAVHEKHLFRCITDGDHVACFKTHGDTVWARLTASLSDYPPFRGLTSEQIYQIQLHRWLFTHGLAFSASNPAPDTWTAEHIVSTVQSGSNAIYYGILNQNVHKGDDHDKKRSPQNGLADSGPQSQ